MLFGYSHLTVFKLCVVILLLLSSASCGVNQKAAHAYLARYGYLKPASAAVTPRAVKQKNPLTLLREAIANFQGFAGLKKTGVLDRNTIRMMEQGRCGMPDVGAIKNGDEDLKWSKTDLTYSIENFSPDLPRDEVRQAIRDAYNVWAEVTPLTFKEVAAGYGDIKIRFARLTHNDPWPFDGVGGTLAHAFYPENGAVHFDEDETWTFRDAAKLATKLYRDLYAVAIHEAGHSLGLEHSKDSTSIMAPIIIPTVDSNGNYLEPELKQEDIDAIQELYGGGSDSDDEDDTDESDDEEETEEGSADEDSE